MLFIKEINQSFILILSDHWNSHPEVKIVKWIQARSNEESDEIQDVAYTSEESDAESRPGKPNEDNSDSNSEKSENESDVEIFTANENKFSALLSDE